MTKTLRALAALLAVLAALVTSGCSAHTPTTVAIVDGQRVTEEQVETVVDRLHAALPAEDPAQMRSFAASWSVIDKMLPRLQRELGVTVSPAEIDKALPELKASVPTHVAKVYEDPAVAPLARAMTAFQVLTAKVKDPSKMSTAISSIPVELNPRYGEWPPTENDGSGFNSISRLFETSPAR